MKKEGWHTPNNVAPRWIVPEWTQSGGGVMESDLVDRGTALRTAIKYLHDRKDTCNKMIRDYQKELAALEEPHPDHCLCDDCVTPENMEERLEISRKFMEQANSEVAK